MPPYRGAAFSYDPNHNGGCAPERAQAITAAFHLFYFIELWVASATQLRPSFLQAWWRDGFHSARWVEYAISATLISLSNFGGVGIRNAPAFIVGAAALVGVQLCGLIAEVARARELHARDAREAAAQEIHDASDEGNEPLLVAVGRHSIVAPLGPRAIDILFQDPFMKKAGDREWRLVEQAYEAVRHPGERPFSVMMRAGHGNPLLYVRECIRKRHCEAPVGFDADKIAQWTAMTIGCLLQGAVFACIFMQVRPRRPPRPRRARAHRPPVPPARRSRCQTTSTAGMETRSRSLRASGTNHSSTLRTT